MASLLSGATSCRFIALTSSRSGVSGGSRRQVRSTTSTATHRSYSLHPSRLASARSERALTCSHSGLAATQDLTALMSSLSAFSGNGSKLISASSRSSSAANDKAMHVESSASFASSYSVHCNNAVSGPLNSSSGRDWKHNFEFYAGAVLAVVGSVLMTSSVTSASPSHLDSPLHPPNIHIGGMASGSPAGGRLESNSTGVTPPGDGGLSKDKAATNTKPFPKSYDISVRALQGERQYMEDEYFIGNGGKFAAVFDGHGGGDVSEYLRERLPGLIDEQLRIKHWEETDEVVTDENPSKIQPSISSRVGAIRSAFTIIDEEVLKNNRLKNVGSTAVLVVVHEGEDGYRTLLSANVGDSRAILSRRGRAVDLTRDHKPNDEREKTRILSMGETIEWDYYSKVHRIRNLSLSRSIGDAFAKPAVSGEVEIKHFPVAEDGDEFFLLASDGLWDVMTSQQVVEFVHERLADSPPPGATHEEDRERLKYARRKNMARYVADEAIARGTGDNVCVVVVWLKDADFTATYE